MINKIMFKDGNTKQKKTKENQINTRTTPK